MAKTKKITAHEETALQVRFIKSPTGKYGLAYSAGDIYTVEDSDVCDEMISSGFAKLIKNEE